MKLFPRHLARRCTTEAKRRMRAHILLDRAVAGHDVPRPLIREELRITGDLQ